MTGYMQSDSVLESTNPRSSISRLVIMQGPKGHTRVDTCMSFVVVSIHNFHAEFYP
jgi:hypothetical protein